ncbi:toll/interleukin-1 receptor domain-containing protein [Streptomyces xinghaiensis]|uniref:toll/interleukin-1 receptor domain-containing protein n=1 Tax=Streptomyces xinghaiensis TaxID=1038928 RepID=UPI0005850C9B|nr:toll/interleukin-1 receptor domain-containing protein [Streptomyces xinghaiensis]MZE79712.1 TIR domain-containing protein [Streptomyces sp. SID5475]
MAARRLLSSGTAAWAAACLATWALFLPLLGPWLALAGLLIPFVVFFPSPPFAALWRVRNDPATLVWSWRRLLRVPTLALPLALLVMCSGVLVVAPSGSPAFWISLVSLPGVVAAFAVRGGSEIHVAGVPLGQERTGPGLRAALPSGSSLVVVALLAAVVSGVIAWVLRDRMRAVVAGVGVPLTDRIGDIERWTDAQIASSVFGPTFDRQWYWALLVGAGGLLAAGCCLLLRNAHLRATAGTDPFAEGSGGFGAPAESTSRVFLSYSRKDSDYARRLCARLEGRLGEIWVDWQAIHPSEEWRESIAEAIRTSDAVVVLLSRDALASPYCWDECRQAIKQRKRILPVVIDPELERGSTSRLLRERGWGELTAYQNLSLADPDEDELAQGVQDIIAFVHQHHRWVAFQVRLGVLAHRWWESGCSDGLLLRADELSVAEAWRRHTPDEQDFQAGPTEEQRRYLGDSRGFVRRRTLRVRSALVAGTAAIIGLSGLVAAGQAGAEAQYRAALSRKLAAMAGDVSGTDPERALQYALAARGQADTAEARNAIAERLTGFNRVRTVVAPRGESVRNVLLSRTGDVLLIARGQASGGAVERGATTEVWDVKRARSRGLLSGSPLDQALTADGRTVALASDDGRSVYLADTRTMRVKDSFSTVEAEVPAGVFEGPGGLSADGRRLWAAAHFADANQNTHVLWDVQSRRIIEKSHSDWLMLTDSDPVQSRVLRDIDPGDTSAVVGFTDDGGVLVNVAGEARVYERGTARPWVPAPGMAAVSSTRKDEGPMLGGHYAVLSKAGGDRFELWDLLDHRLVGSANSVDKAVELRRGDGAPEFETADRVSEAESADGSLVAAAAADGSVVLWEKGGAGRISERLPVPAKEGAYAVGPGARTVAAAVGRTVSLWDTGTGERTGSVGLSDIGNTLAFSRDGSLLAVAEVTRGAGREPPVRVEVFRVRDSRLVARYEPESDAKNPIGSLMFSPDGKKLYAAVTGAFRVVVWDLADSGGQPRTVADTQGHGYADHAALSPDGTKLAVTGRDSTVGLWDTASGTRLRLIEDAAHAAFSPDGRTLATRDRSARSVSFWNGETGRRIGGDIVPGSRAFHVRFSPDGHRLAIVGSPEGGLVSRLPVTLWDVSSRQQVGPQVAEVDAYGALGFSPDGDRVVTAGRYGTFIADVSADGRVSSLCGMVTRRLSAPEWQDIAPGERYRWPC